MRISFAGGGSDLPVYYREHGGAVLSTAIDKYVYLCLNRAFGDHVRVAYSHTEDVARVADLDHRLFRTVLTKLGVETGVEIASVADIPSRGSGLGSSSAFTVGLLNAVHAWQGRSPPRAALAAEACEVEIDLCGDPIGKQDQYAAAMGGLNFIRFNPDDTVDVEPVLMPAGARAQVQGSLMMFYTGMTRSASNLLQVQADNLATDADKRRATGRLARMAEELRDELMLGNAAALGESLHEGWMLKKSLAAGISSGFLDDAYSAARSAGAVGGKLLGAGGGGFFLFWVADDRRAAVRAALSGLTETPFSLDTVGASIVLQP
jgi:D-glycero-alpha-D-manno-heptose-7-phosphate kinase